MLADRERHFICASLGRDEELAGIRTVLVDAGARCLSARILAPSLHKNLQVIYPRSFHF
jgi:hypothetical protein